MREGVTALWGKASNTETNCQGLPERKIPQNIKLLILKDFEKLAWLLLSLWHNKNKKQQTNKNKTKRL
ncbi:conserved hypothetical protein [Pseudomonas sp. IT-P12]